MHRISALALTVALTGLSATYSPIVAAEGAAQAGSKLPEFSLRDTDGKQVTNADLAGKTSLINFWATWCQPCMVEMKYLDGFDRDETLKGKGFQVISVSIDDARSASMVKPTVKRNGYGFRVLLDKDTTFVGQVNPAKTLPYSMLVDGKGNIVWSHLGYTPGDEVEMKTQIEAALAAPK